MSDGDPGRTAAVGSPPPPPAAPPPEPGPSAPQAPAAGAGDLTDRLIGTSVWSDEMVAEAGIPVVDVPLVSVGGGLGSFALVDYLRIAGVPTSDIRVLGLNERPWATYANLARNSQIPDHERLRSDAGSVMDNIWGFPSYAVREAFAERSLKPLWTVATEPILAEYFTPRAGQVYTSVDRECARIDWPSMLVQGQVRMVRKRVGGGYFTILTPPAGSTPTKRVAYRSRFAHISVGYPGLKFLPDLQEFKTAHNDLSKVVNAYEPHNHVYEDLMRGPGTVLVRGSGIVGSRVLQRLLDDVERNGAQTTVWHLFRNYVSGPQGDFPNKRPGRNGFAYQAFNFPKAAWGGQTREELLNMQERDRPDFIRVTGGTNTAPRQSWSDQLQRMTQSGNYRQQVGEVVDIKPGPDGTIVNSIRAKETGQVWELPANYIIDATGLEADIEEHRLLADLLEHGGAAKNPVGRLDASPAFELTGTASDPGRMYASGSITLGSFFTPVDSFLGLQYAGLNIADDLARNGFGRKITAGRSISQWFKWMGNQRI